jgi:hypothetical protein
MPQKVIIIGCGGHSAELDDYFFHARKKDPSFDMEIAGLIDDNAASYAVYRFSAPFMGNIRDHVVQQDCRYLMGIANLRYRRPIIERFLSMGARFAQFVHPDAYISRSATLGEGVDRSHGECRSECGDRRLYPHQFPQQYGARYTGGRF